MFALVQSIDLADPWYRQTTLLTVLLRLTLVQKIYVADVNFSTVNRPS